MQSFYFDMQLIGRYFDERKSEVYPESPEIKERIFRCHVIKIIQGHEINVKIELAGSLHVNTRPAVGGGRIPPAGFSR